MLGKAAAWCDRIVLKMADARGAVWAGYTMLAIVMLMVAFTLKLHDVRFAGALIDGQVGGLGVGVVKQVGYMWAPNWALASILILPAAILNLLAARASAETIPAALLERGMLVRLDGGEIDPAALRADWRATSRRWSMASVLWLPIIAVFILATDFLPVVGNWLGSADFRAEALAGGVAVPDGAEGRRTLTIGHPEYEFDWSIAAIYPQTDLHWTVNYGFSLAAYLLVPILGAGMLMAGFVWFASVSIFYSGKRLRTLGYSVRPDLQSTDKRRGFEIFEDLFDNLLRAGLLTAAMALCMHYQNVYLRAPEHTNILDLLFGDAIETAAAALDWNFGPLMSYFVSFDSVIYMDEGGISMQTYATALANLLVFCIVIALMWRWLRKLAIEGAQETARTVRLTRREKERLKTMEIWPVGWMSRTLLTLVLAATLAAMYFVNLLSLLLVVLLIYGLKGLVAATVASAFGGFGAGHDLQFLDDDDEDNDEDRGAPRR